MLNGEEEKETVDDLRRRISTLMRKTSSRAMLKLKKDSRLSTAQISALLAQQAVKKVEEESKGIISLPQWSIYHSSTAVQGELANFAAKPYEVSAQSGVLDLHRWTAVGFTVVFGV